MEKLMLNLKMQIIEVLNLQGVSPDQIGDEQLLFAEDGLGLDSIDALEMIVLLQQHYNIKISDPQEGPIIFRTVKSIAEYIQSHQ